MAADTQASRPGEREAALREPELHSAPSSGQLARSAPAEIRNRASAPAAPTLPVPQARRWRLSLTLKTFIAFVLLPTAATWFYLVFVAAHQFTTQMRFVVRGSLETIAPAAGVPGASGELATLAQQNNSQEAHVIADYVRSRAIVTTLDSEFDLRRMFGVGEHDPVFGLWRDASTDDLVKFWNRQVRVGIEALSGVVTVDVRAFRPTDAVTLSQAILRHAEDLANAISLRSRQEEMEQTTREWRQAADELSVASRDLRSFRDASGTIDPTESAKKDFQAIAQLRDERSALNTDLATARARLQDDSPVVRTLREKLRSLDDRITALDETLFRAAPARGNGTNSVLADAALLESRRRLAEERYRQAEAAVDSARSELERRQVYIVVFAPPTSAGEWTFPSPSLFTGGTFAVLLAVWGIVALYGHGVRQRTR